MLRMVEVRTTQGTLLSLPLQDLSDGLLIQEIEGLDPVKATLVSSSFARLDGEQYQTSRREARNIKLQIGLEPDYVTTTVSGLRRRVYSYFMPKTKVSLRLYMDDGLTVDISGRVESCESAMFTNEPVMDISIMCFDPDFIDLDPVDISWTTTSLSTELLVPYVGSVESGILFTLYVDRTLSQFTIYHRPPDDTQRSLDFAAPLEMGDVLSISTMAGAKGATVNRSGTISSLLYGISPQSNWIELMPGDNYIRVYAEGDAIPFDIQYFTKYGGF